MLELHHVAMRTCDVSRLAAFYSAWLDLPIVRDESPRAIWLGLERAVLMIERAGDDEPAVARGSLELLAFRVSAAARSQLRERLSAQGLLESETAETLYLRD